MKILVGVNALTSVNSYVYSSHCNFWYWLGKHHSETEFLFFTPPRMSIDRMRNEAAKAALQQHCDYLMFVDDDVVIPKNCLNFLIDERFDITAGMTVIRGYPYNLMNFKYIDPEKTKLDFYNDYKKEDADEKGFITCDAVGFSCALIKVELLTKLSKPYFVTGPFNTEDIYFCVKAFKEFPDVKMAFNVNVWTAHLGEPKMLTPYNRHLYKKFEETETPEVLEKKSVDRGTEYRDKCIKTFESST